MNMENYAPFLSKCYDMVDDPATDPIISWSDNNNSFIVWNQASFAQDLLPKYFKHSNFSSFVRQLNQYGFKKVNPDCLEFANDGFRKGKKHLLKTITRRKPTHSNIQQEQHQAKNTSVAPCIEVGKLALKEELERLNRDKNVLMQELVKLRQHQQSTDHQLLGVTQRIQGMEQHQQQMLSFFVMVMQTPGFLSTLLQQNDNNRRVADPKKRRHLPTLKHGIKGECTTSHAQIVKYQPSMNESPKPLLMPLMNNDVPSELDPSAKGEEEMLISANVTSQGTYSSMNEIPKPLMMPLVNNNILPEMDRSPNGEDDMLISANMTPHGTDTSSPMEFSSDLPDDLMDQLLSATVSSENNEENELYMPGAEDMYMWLKLTE